MHRDHHYLLEVVDNDDLDTYFASVTDTEVIKSNKIGESFALAPASRSRCVPPPVIRISTETRQQFAEIS